MTQSYKNTQYGSSASSGGVAVAYTSSTVTPNQVIDSISAQAIRTVKYLVQMTSGGVYQAIEILIIQDGANVYIEQYASIGSAGSLGSFDATISNGVVQLLFTPVNAVTTIKANRTTIAV